MEWMSYPKEGRSAGPGGQRGHVPPVTQIAFRVQRQLLDAAGQATGWTDLPSDGAARFVDPGVPIGTSQVAYRVKALRGGLASGWSEPGQLRFVGTAASETTLRIAA